MAPVVPNPAHVRGFPDAKAFEQWLQTNHARADELWVKFHKQGSGLPSVSYAEALDSALCWGWIDGMVKTLDENSYLRRFTPRQPRSIWSKINCEHVARLTAAGRMRPEGLAQVAAAKADGRWDKAYQGAGKLEFPADLLAAIEAEPAALELFARLNSVNRYALALRTHNIKTPAGRQRKIAAFVEMLKRGETIYPNGPGRQK